MRTRLSFLFLAALALAPPLALHAQGTAADTAHWRAAKIDLDSIARDRTAPAYSKRAQSRIRVRDSLRLVGPVVPPPPPPPPPPVQTAVAKVDIRPSSGTFPTGQAITFTGIPRDALNNALSVPVSWSSNPTGISGLGVLTPTVAGSVAITAKADTASRAITIQIVDAVDTTVVKPDTTAAPPVTGTVGPATVSSSPCPPSRRIRSRWSGH